MYQVNESKLSFRNELYNPKATTSYILFISINSVLYHTNFYNNFWFHPEFDQSNGLICCEESIYTYLETFCNELTKILEAVHTSVQITFLDCETNKMIDAFKFSVSRLRLQNSPLKLLSIRQRVAAFLEKLKMSIEILVEKKYCANAIFSLEIEADDCCSMNSSFTRIPKNAEDSNKVVVWRPVALIHLFEYQIEFSIKSN
jgi:hypothetical protein